MLVTLLFGCAAVEMKKQISIGEKTLTNTELLVRLMQRNAKLESLKSLAKISYRAGQEKGGFEGVIVVSRPDRFRLEAFSMFGTALVVTVDAGFSPW